MVVFRTYIAVKLYRLASAINRIGTRIMPPTERVLRLYNTRFIAGEDGKVVDLRKAGL